MDIRRANQKYKSFGGIRLLRAYYRLGVLGILMRTLMDSLLHGRTLKSIYPIVTNSISGQLKDEIWKGCCHADADLSTASSPKVWFCWLQGLKTAPEMVRVCYEAVCKYMPEREVVVIDGRNYEDYVEVPGFVKKKYRNGVIPTALFSDILRLELLIKYGGTWIDSTLLMTEPGMLLKHDWLDEIMNAELFMFQYYTRDKRFAGIGNWFITAMPGHWALRTVRDTLYEYWQRYDCVVDYYIFHRVFMWIAEERPEVIEQMPRRRAVPSLYLRDRLAMDHDEGFWNELTSHVCLHKLNYRKESEAKANGSSYWNKILNKDSI